jgi:hypothetical protein
MKSRFLIITYFLVASHSFSLSAQPEAQAPHILTFFFKPLLAQKTQAISPEFYNKFLKTPGNISRAFITQWVIAPLVYGIFVTYRGLVTHSDFNGQISFPLRQEPETVTMVVTGGIKPVLLFSNTVHHLELVEDFPADFYQFSRRKDELHKTVLWDVRKIKPKNRRIPDDALVVIAPPSQIVVIEGKFSADQSPNFILPNIYVSDAITMSSDALQFLKVAKFFEPVHKAFGYAPDRYATIMTN